jgi:hypothetical protein
LLLEKRIGGEDAIAEPRPGSGNDGMRARGDDDAAGDDLAPVRFETIRPQKACPCRKAPFAQIFCGLQRALHKIIAKSSHPRQNGRHIDNQLFAAADPEGLEIMAAVIGIGGLDQRLGGHAADPRTGGAPGAVVDEQEIVGFPAHLAQCRQPCRAGADDDDVDFLSHVSLSILFSFSMRRTTLETVCPLISS